MKYSTKLVLKMFLDSDLKRSKVMGHDKIDLVFKQYFSDQELINMILWLQKREMISEQFLQYLDNLESHDAAQLFAIIEKRSNLLAYYMYLWRFENDWIYEAKGIKKILEGINKSNHLLYSKAPEKWTRAEYTQYQQLLLDAGYLLRAYGIYDKSVALESTSMVTSQPERFFDTYEEAENGIKELVRDQVLKAEDVHILYILVHS